MRGADVWSEAPVWYLRGQSWDASYEYQTLLLANTTGTSFPGQTGVGISKRREYDEQLEAGDRHTDWFYGLETVSAKWLSPDVKQSFLPISPVLR